MYLIELDLSSAILELTFFKKSGRNMVKHVLPPIAIHLSKMHVYNLSKKEGRKEFNSLGNIATR